MIPILFPSTATEFKTQGLGALSDAISCTVTEERNGIFELEMEYPMTGLHFGEIADRCIILAIPSPYRLPQPFRIYRITKPLNGICTIYAQHITYDLSGVPLNPFTAASAPAAMAGLQSNAAIESPFAFWTNKTTTAGFAVTVPSSTRSVLGGRAGSILDAYGGEYEWDNFTVKLHAQRGQDNGVVIRYGKNLTDLEQDRNISNVATGIYPYWTDMDGNLVTCNPKVIPAPGTYNFTRVIPVDFSQDFKEKPTPEQLQERGEGYVNSNNIGVPSVSLSVNFAQLEQTEEYKHLALLEKCDLCDIVAVQFEDLGVDAKAKIVKIKTNVLLEKYISTEIGDVRSNIADSILGQQQEIQKRPVIGEVKNIANAIAAIVMGASGGCIRLLDTNGDGVPDTLYMADKPNPEEAKEVWRFNYKGWAASKNGYNGPFEMAAALGLGLYANFITVGTLNAALVKVINLIADHVQSKSGNYLMELWAAVLKLMDGENLRVRLYTTGTKESAGLLQVFAGTIKEDGTKDETTRYSFLSPTMIGVGETENKEYVGTIFAGASETRIARFEAVRPAKGQNTLTTDWKRASELTQDDWVLVGSEIVPNGIKEVKSIEN